MALDSPMMTKVALEDRSRIKEPLLSMLNNQITAELQSANMYKAMACWLDDKRRFKLSKYFLKYGQEEMEHMDKIIEFCFDRNSKACIEATIKPQDAYSSLRDVFEKSLEHEIQVTSMWEAIANKAKEIGDNTTYSFSKWYVDEQVEEENKFRNILFAMDNGTPDWYIELNFESIV